jgi:hypothetical protein
MTPALACGSGISLEPTRKYTATQPIKISACIINQSLSLPRAFTVSERFSPVARWSSLRISGLFEISSAVSAITIKIAFGEEMGATILLIGHDGLEATLKTCSKSRESTEHVSR